MSNAKPIDALSVDDLRIHPIWEYATDCEEEHDETYVRPVMAATVPEDPHVVYHAACEVTTANGRSYSGFISICNGVLHHEAPVVLGGGDQYWPLDPRFCLHFAKKFEGFFGVPYDSLFPVQWRLLASVANKSIPISGFYHGG